MNSQSLQFQNNSPWNLLLILIIAAILFFTYRNADRKIARRHGLLLLIRSFIFILLLIVLCKPILKWSSTKKLDPEVVIFLDRSLSMTAHENVTKDSIVSVVNGIRTILEENGVNVKIYPFSTGIEENIRSLKELKFDADGTDLSEVLKFCKEKLSGLPVQGGIIISDGVFTAGENPMLMNLNPDFPLFTIGIGDSLMILDPAVDEIIIPTFASIGDSINIEARVLPLGHGKTITVALMEEDQIIQKKVLPSFQQSLLQSVRFEIVPDRTGVIKYSVLIDTTMDRNPLNNIRKKLLRVTNNRKRFLIVQGNSNFDVRFISKLVQSMPGIEPVSLLESDEKWHSVYGEDPFQMKWDAVAFFGFPTDKTSRQHLDIIASKINQDRSAVYIHYLPNMNINKLNSMFSRLIIENFRLNQKEISAVSVQLSDSQKNHPIVMPLRRNLSYKNDWAALPPVGMPFENIQLAPRFFTLLESANSDRIPIISIGETAGVRQVVVTGIDLWRWSMMTADAENNYIYSELFTGLISWLTDTLSSSNLQFSMNKDIYLKGEIAEITGVVTDVQGQVLPQAVVQGEIVDSRNNSSEFLIQWDGKSFNGRVPLRSEGEYYIKIEASVGDVRIGETQEDFLVMENSVELLTVRQNIAALRSIATMTGAAYSTPENFKDLLTELEFKPDYRKVQHEIKLWRRREIFILLISLLIAEWLIRRLSGLQ